MIKVQTYVMMTNLLRILFCFLSMSNTQKIDMLVQVHPQVTLPPCGPHG